MNEKRQTPDFSELRAILKRIGWPVSRLLKETQPHTSVSGFNNLLYGAEKGGEALERISPARILKVSEVFATILGQQGEYLDVLAILPLQPAASETITSEAIQVAAPPAYDDVLHAYLQEGISRSLSERDAVVLNLRYYEGRTLKEVGDKLGITRERVRQLESRGMRKLRGYFGMRAKCVGGNYNHHAEDYLYS